MIRAVLLVPERAVGWQPQGALPLLSPAETGAHAALCAGGVPLRVIGEDSFLSGAAQPEWDLVIMVRPTEGSSRTVESAMKSASGSLLRIQDLPADGSSRGPRFLRNFTLEEPGGLLEVSRLPLRSRIAGWRARLSLPTSVVLHQEAGDEVVGRWIRGGPALLCRTRDRMKVWTAGFPPDHLDAEDLSRFLALLVEGRSGRGEVQDPVPAGARAVVILLHDVEEALPDDPRGVQSVREGTEGCLELEVRYRIRATYNL